MCSGRYCSAQLDTDKCANRLPGYAQTANAWLLDRSCEQTQAGAPHAIFVRTAGPATAPGAQSWECAAQEECRFPCLLQNQAQETAQAPQTVSLIEPC